MNNRRRDEFEAMQTEARIRDEQIAWYIRCRLTSRPLDSQTVETWITDYSRLMDEYARQHAA